jgi:hypothetical protein
MAKDERYSRYRPTSYNRYPRIIDVEKLNVITGIVMLVESMPSSEKGNLRFAVMIDDVPYATIPDDPIDGIPYLIARRVRAEVGLDNGMPSIYSIEEINRND